MSPISIKLFRSSPSPVELNGPILSFSQQPVSISQTSGGSVTFAGIATATFPEQSPSFLNKNLGVISYQWYEVGVGPIFEENTTSLTVDNLITPTDSEREFYLEARYTPSSYDPGLDLVTPRAINSPLNSDTIKLTVYPQISITTQPTSQSAAIENSVTFTVQGSLTDTTQGNISYQWQINGSNLSNGNISLGSTILTVSGANNQTLTISSNTIGVNSIRAVLTHPVAGNSPFFSDEISFNAVEPRSIIKIEGYNGDSSVANLSEINVDDGGELALSSDTHNYDFICLYASEKDVDIELDLYGSKGSDIGSFVGGEGGYSRINLTMQKNDEYIITGIKENEGIFLYRKASLISVVGSGGDAGISGNGGPGGGINLSGGAAPSGSNGGSLIPEESLTLNGTFGSIVPETINLYPGDARAQSPNGGQTISCTKGIYWLDIGISPCQNVGTVRFRLSNGVEVSNSAQISRGFKPGYSIRQTGGKKTVVGGGNGGTGATGGSGSSNNFGGGGGSGYTNGTVNVVSSTIGGSTGKSRVNVRLFNGDFYVDSFGRILILSCATPGKDPRTLTKTIGKVLVNTDTCIDDARWKNFIDLATNSPSGNYRLAVTLNNNTSKLSLATENNLYKLKNSNRLPLRESLTGWVPFPGRESEYILLAWEEDSGFSGSGSDYSGLLWGKFGGFSDPNYFAYYTESSEVRRPFIGTYYTQTTANWWILPPGVPDF
jgi:hypothetical protein